DLIKNYDILLFQLVKKFSDIVSVLDKKIFYPIADLNLSKLNQTEPNIYTDSYCLQLHEADAFNQDLVYFLREKNTFVIMFKNCVETNPSLIELEDKLSKYIFYPNKDSEYNDIKHVGNNE